MPENGKSPFCPITSKYRNYDPIKFEVFHENTNWILEDEPTNWTMEELETFQNELAACTIQDNQNDIS